MLAEIAPGATQRGPDLMSTKNRKHTFGIAGEYFVSAELNRRGIHASMTYGNMAKEQES
jgi:hypothetical protein